MTKILTALALAGVAAGASADTFFSFASDDSDQSWTFSGSGSSFTASIANSDPLSLLIEGGNSGPAFALDVVMTGDITVRYVTTVAMPSGESLHVYSGSGSFDFSDTGGNLLMTLDIAAGSFTSFGTANAWGTSATFQSNDMFQDQVTYTATAALIAAIPNPSAVGLAEGPSLAGDDFAFTMTSINSDGSIPYGGVAPGVALDGGFLPNATWYSEGSYSGSAREFVPTPGASALLGLGGLAMARRRR